MHWIGIVLLGFVSESIARAIRPDSGPTRFVLPEGLDTGEILLTELQQQAPNQQTSGVSPSLPLDELELSKGDSA